MFVTVLFGDNRLEMLNLDCKLMHFIRHLKERCGVKPTDRVELMDRKGALMNLEGKQNSPDRTSSLLAESQYYALLRVCRDEPTGDPRYVSLLNSSQSHPELIELLRKLSQGRQRDKKFTSVKSRLRRGSNNVAHKQRTRCSEKYLKLLNGPES